MGWQDDPVVGQAPTPSAPKAAWQSDPVVSGGPSAAKPGKRKTSEVLGFEKGILRPLDNLTTWMDGGQGLTADSPLAKNIVAYRQAHPNAPTIPSVRSLVDAGNAHVTKEAQSKRPGLLGEVAGNIVGTLPTVAITRNPLAVGAMQGALTSEQPNDAGQVAADALMGAGLNWAGGKLVDKAAEVLKPTVSAAASTLQKWGVKMTPGQLSGNANKLAREDKAMSRPIVGPMISADRQAFNDSLNRGAINRAMMPLGLRLPDNINTGHDAVAWMQDQLGQSYDRILPQLGLQPDARLAVGLRKGSMIAQGLPADAQDTFANLLRQNLDFNSQGGVLSGRQLTRAVRDLRTKAAGYSKSATEAERQLGQALSEVLDGLDSSLMAQNPQFAPRLKATNAAYRDSQVVNRAASMADEGVASSGQLKTASRAVDRSKGKRMTAAGNGPMQDFTTAARAVTGKTPNSGTADRLMEGSLLAKGRGLVDAGLYQGDKLMSALAQLPRPAPVQQVGGLLQQFRTPLSIVGGPALGGLLAGLLADE